MSEEVNHVESGRQTRIAVAGFGYWGQNLGRNIMSANSTTLVGVADPSPEGRSRARATYSNIYVWESLEEALCAEAVDAVALATPASTHGELARAALARGKHVFVEKPLALDIRDAESVARAAIEAKRTVMVGHTFLYSSPVQRLRDLIRRGELGDVKYLYSQRLSLGRIRSDCDSLWNFAPHDISIALYLLGELPVHASAAAFTFLQRDVRDVYFGSLRFPSGVGFNLHVSWMDPRKVRLMTVVGDRKMAVYDDVSVDQKIAIYDSGVASASSESSSFGDFSSFSDFQWRTRAGDVTIPRIEMWEPLRSLMDAFGRACQGEELPHATVTEGVQVVRVLEALERSASEGGREIPIEWP